MYHDVSELPPGAATELVQFHDEGNDDMLKLLPKLNSLQVMGAGLSLRLAELTGGAEEIANEED